MGDEGDYWRDVKPAMVEASKRRRANNREHGAAALERAGIAFTEHNGGAHLVVQPDGRTVDYWPGTGKWIARGRPQQVGRGIHTLLVFLNTDPTRHPGPGVLQRMEREAQAQPRRSPSHSRPRITGPATPPAHCGCNVLPWEDCIHTRKP